MTLVKRNLIANALGQAWGAVMNLAFIPLVIAYLGIEAYGLVGLFTVLMAVLPLLDMGMTPALGREMARFTAGAHTAQSIGDLLRSLETVCYMVAATIALGTWAGSGLLAGNWLRSEHLPVEVVAHAVSIMAFVVGLRFCEGIYRSALVGLQRQVLLNGVNAILATTRYGGVVAVLACISPTIEAYFIWQGLVSMLTITVFAVVVHRALPAPPAPARFRWSALRSVQRFASGMMGITLLAILLTQTDKLLLSRLLTLSEFGYYTLAVTIASSLCLITSPVTQALYPRMVQCVSRGEEDQLAALYHRGAQLVTVLVAPGLCLLCFFGDGVIFLWTGDETLAAHTAPLLSVLVVGTFLNAMMWMPYQCQLAHGWTTLGVRVNLVAVAILVPAILLVVPRYGAIGAAWIWVALNSGYVMISVQLMHRRILKQEKWRWYGSDIILPVFGALAVAVPAFFLPLSTITDRWACLWFVIVVGLSSVVVAALMASRIRAKVNSLIFRTNHCR